MAEANKQAKNEKLELWQRRLADSNAAFSAEVAKMDDRERLYNGERYMKPLVEGDHKKDGERKQTSHVRNIVFENIESQVSSSIPQPKVTACRKQDEHLAEVIEHFLRNELDRMPFEAMNDLAERTVPIQGGVGFLVEWDNRKRTSSTVGEVRVSVIHPKQFAPQPGIYTGIRDMDWFIIKLPTTRDAVRRRYGVDVSDESEAEPEVRGAGDESAAEDALTQYIGFEVNEVGGIDRYSWVNDVELEDLENYQARRQPVCAGCGRTRPLPGQEANGTAYDGGQCPWCGGGEWKSAVQEFEQVVFPIETASGKRIEGLHLVTAEDGTSRMEPGKIPFYTPDLYPIILQRSVSVFGQLLGNSDADMIRDQQNTTNRLEQKILDRIIKAGTRITLPDKADLRTDPEDGERWFLRSPEDKSMIGVYEFSGNLQFELVHLGNVYEEARQILGITDSFQGRKDPTATSGKAKEFSAAQSAGRLESKRVMKNAAYAEMFELMFKFWLAYSDEPRPVSYKNFEGETEYQEFNRYDFLEMDEAGNYWWNDQFLFSCDTTAPLANNREALWQETRMNLQTGAFGDPGSTDTLILFWSKMEELHYPGAGATKKFLEDRLAKEQQAMQRAAMEQQAAMVQAQGQTADGLPPELGEAVELKAREDALPAVQGGAGA